MQIRTRIWLAFLSHFGQACTLHCPFLCPFLCATAVALSPLACLHGIVQHDSAAILTLVLQALITISPNHPFNHVTAPALLAHVVSKTGAVSSRVKLTISTSAAPCDVVSKSWKIPWVVLYCQPNWLFVGKSEVASLHV